MTLEAGVIGVPDRCTADQSKAFIAWKTPVSITGEELLEILQKGAFGSGPKPFSFWSLPQSAVRENSAPNCGTSNSDTANQETAYKTNRHPIGAYGRMFSFPFTTKNRPLTARMTPGY